MQAAESRELRGVVGTVASLLSVKEGYELAVETALGAAAMVEMTYHLQLNAALGPQFNFLGATLNVTGLASWFGAGFVLLTGLGLFELCRRQFLQQWSRIQEEIEHEIQRGEAL